MFESFLNKKYDLKRNIVTNQILIKDKKDKDYQYLDDVKFNTLLIKLQKKGFKVNASLLDCYLYSEYVVSFDPFKSYFENLTPWDKSTDYIDELAKTVDATNNDYFKWAFKKWIVALVGCALNEDTINQSVIIFSGNQGIGKTTWIRNLMPIELKTYLFEGIIIPNDKDSKFHLADKLLINMDELGSFGKSKNEFYKGLITLDNIEQRRPYSRKSSRLMRRASFIASTNNIEILSDLTGNRRYLCLEVIKFNNQKRIDIDKVFSQAYSLFKSGFQFYFDSEDIHKIECENKKYLQTPEEYDLIEEYFELPDGNNNAVLMTATEILDFILERRKPHKHISVEMIGKSLVALGFKKVTKLKKYRVKLK